LLIVVCIFFCPFFASLRQNRGVIKKKKATKGVDIQGFEGQETVLLLLLLAVVVIVVVAGVVVVSW
jgi:hypothetical protein